MTLLTDAKINRLSSNERAFDAKVLQSTLEYYNSAYADPDYRQRFNSVGNPLNDLFSWIPQVLKIRAARAMMTADEFDWRGPKSLLSVARMSSVLLFMFGAFKKSLDETGISLDGAQRISAETWLFEILNDVRIESRYARGKKGAIELASVPRITSPEAAVAYSLALVKTDRHGFSDLVRPCQFLKDEPGMLTHHYFLADDARQKFCSSAHANAHRQRELRRRSKQARKPK